MNSREKRIPWRKAFQYYSIEIIALTSSSRFQVGKTAWGGGMSEGPYRGEFLRMKQVERAIVLDAAGDLF